MDFISDLMGIIRKGPEMASQINTLDINNKSIIRGAMMRHFSSQF